MYNKISFLSLALIAACFIAATFSTKIYYKPAKLKNVTGNLCQYLPYVDSIWGLDMKGNREPLDSLAIMLNIDRKLICNYQLSEVGANVIKVKLSNTFDNSENLNQYLFNHAERYRNVNFNGEISANMFVAPDGTYMGHKIIDNESFKVFKPLAKVFPFYMLQFTPGESNDKPIMDTVKVTVKIQMEEELFVKP